MMIVGIICKRGKKEAVELLRQLVPWLRERAIEVCIDSYSAREIEEPGVAQEDIAEHCDMVMVLGGDGTMLAASRLVAQRNIPIFGINLGGLGFITEVSIGELFDVIEKVITGKCPAEDRIMLNASVIRDGKTLATYTVLNDVVITKGALARIFDLEMFIDGSYVTTFRADGMIVSSPTGSTAYSLSAGGPILYPTLHCFVITPICSHTLTNRPIVVNDNMVIEIVVGPGSDDVYLTLDGQLGQHLKEKDVVSVKRSEHMTRLLIPCERDYFQILREKLKWGER
ncbi:NAD(+)/NADH kinase [Candidatus Magnetomonas plexicatena]|uniref:NAD(+)/NADH kinase n=1 Tax=Candidatus Magnetomonas plexicatena TaxID=2552947 RepID=UPI001C763EB9|nr:NAD(+) kinase [Nitrospirales bacterium LBB_01]